MSAIGSNTQVIPIFNGENYDFWAIKFKAVLRGFDLWKVVENGIPAIQSGQTLYPHSSRSDQSEPATPGLAASTIGPATSSASIIGGAGAIALKAGDLYELERKDGEAMAKIYSAVDDMVFPRIMNAVSAKDAWDTLKIEYAGTTQDRKQRLQILRRNFENLRMKEGELLQKYTSRLFELVNQMKALGGDITNQRVVEKMLVSLTSKYDGTVSIIEQTRDLTLVSPLEIVSALQAQEFRNQARTEVGIEDALYAKQIPKVQKHSKTPAKKEKHVGNFFDSRQTGKKKFSPCGVCGKTNHLEKKCWKKEKPKCSYCNKFGHVEKDCWLKKGRLESIENDLDVANVTEEDHLFMVTGDNIANRSKSWILDSGCTSHMVCDKDVFWKLDMSTQTPVKLANGEYIKSRGKGIVVVDTDAGNRTLNNVLFVPQLKQNLISVGQLLEDDYKLVFDKKRCLVYDQTQKLLADVKMIKKSFLLEWSETEESSLNVQAENNSKLWHMRYGHSGIDKLISMSKNQIVRDLPQLEDLMGVCEGCKLGKMSRLSFPTGTAWRAKKKLELVHSDICGPMRTETLEGSRYFVTFIDDYTRMTWVYFLKEKSEVFKVFQMFKAKVETESDCQLKCIRTDNGKEYVSTKFNEFCHDQGVKRQLTTPYSPQQNGVCERKNRSLMEMSRCMLYAKDLPHRFWAEAVNTATYLQNRCTTKALIRKTPYEGWTGHKPTSKHLKIFGCICFYHVPVEKRTKLDAKAVKAIFIGYSTHAKAYRLYCLKTQKIVISRDVIFDEDAKWDGEETTKPEIAIKAVELLKSGGKLSNATTEEQSSHSPENHSPNPSGSHINLTSSSSKNSAESSSSSATTPLRYKNLSELYDALPRMDVCNVVLEDPISYEDASKHDQWKKAMMEEISMIQKNETWSLVTLPNGKKPIGVKWVYRTKHNPDGSILKHKARLVVKGYSQRFGVDYTETFAPVSRLDTIKTILVVAAQKNWKLYQMDVKSAFLNGTLIEEIYVEQPEGFIAPGNEDKVLKLNKALYGLKQAPRAWYSKIDSYFSDLGFSKSPSEHTLYIKGNGTSNLVIVSLYVDDMIITGNASDLINEFKKKMEDKFEMTDLGLMKYFLGIEITQEECGLFIKQEKYSTELLKRFGMFECKPVSTPMSTGQKLLKQDDSGAANQVEYRSIVGSLLYLCTTRPDIMYATSVLSRYMQYPTKDHMTAAKRVLRYIKGTIDFGLWYGSCISTKLVGYCDSDWAGCEDDLKSTSGNVFLLNDSLITWHTQKQETVAQSTAEAEYISCCTAVNQCIWLRRVLGDLGIVQSCPTMIFCDNKSAIAIAKNPVMHRRTKHIQIKYHFVREAEQLREISVCYCKGDDQLADIFTKNLPTARFELLRKRLGICRARIKEEYVGYDSLQLK